MTAATPRHVAVRLSALEYDVLKRVREGQDPRCGLRGKEGAPRVRALTCLAKLGFIRKDESMSDAATMGYVLTSYGSGWLGAK